ncbi:MAG: hypothetical protein O9340_08020 [Cyclobacteriaceae bacterium]|nr:hypothetical protein [Cyclobacteriaceae bacterium]
MELLYVWIEDYYVLKDIGFNFSSKYEIKEEVDVDNRVIKLELHQRSDYVIDFFTRGILSVTAIVGENGVGKSTLLDFIRLINHHPDLIYTSWVAVYFNHKKQDIEIRGNLGPTLRKWTIKLDNNLIGKYTNLESSIYGSVEAGEYSIFTIFYNPSLDLKNYGKSFHDLRAGLVDVSTNFMIEKDWESKNTDDTSVDQILNHRYKNTYRQFALSQLKASTRYKLTIPSSIEVRFNRNRTVEKSDLSFSAKIVFEHLSELGRNNAQIINGEIENSLKGKDEESFIKASLMKVKNWFLVNLLENYNQQLTKWYDFQKNQFNQFINVSDFQNLSFFESLRLFFDKQDFIKSSKYSINQFVNDIFQIIDSKATLDISFGELINDSIFTIPIEDAIEVHKAHFKYLALFRSNSDDKNLGFLDLNWSRDVSNGEKAKFDLYSRLYDGYRDLQYKLLSKTLYLIIDEGELGFHPQWQKEYISSLINFSVEVFEGNQIQIILTSHSPFVLSDLPKSNVVLLNKKESGETFVDKLPSKEQTFAANIHELFADSFFMRNGTIGDFAKNKIEELIRIFELPKKDIDKINEADKSRIKKLILLIGEPIIRDRLMDMYKDKFRERQETLEERVNRLRKELKNAENQLKKPNDKN